MDRDIRMILGDCRTELRRLPDCSVDCIVTDPPFGHSNNNGDLIHNREKVLGERKRGWHGRDSVTEQSQNPARPILNDGPEANQLFKDVLPEFKRLLREGGCCCCCCGGGGPDPQFARWSLWIDQVLEFKQMVVFDKGPIGMGWHYRRSYETILVAMKPGGPCRWYDESGQVENIIRPGQYGIKKIIPNAKSHPCAKPVALAAHFLRLHTQKGDTVLDPFAGAGWVGVACKRMGRKFIGIELDPHWHKVAERRIDKARPGFLCEVFK